jgi:hypothetical protein
MPDESPIFFGTDSDYRVVYSQLSTKMEIAGNGNVATGVAPALVLQSKGAAGAAGVNVTSGNASLATDEATTSTTGNAVSGDVSLSTGDAQSTTGLATTGNISLTTGTPMTGGTATRGRIVMTGASVSMTADSFKPPAFSVIQTAGAAFRYTTPIALLLAAATGAVSTTTTITGGIFMVTLRKTTANGGAGASATLAVNGSTVCLFDLTTANQNDVLICDSLANQNFGFGDVISLTLAGTDPQCSVTVQFLTATA